VDNVSRLESMILVDKHEFKIVGRFKILIEIYFSFLVNSERNSFNL